MRRQVSRVGADESLGAKARWFQSLPFAEHMELLCEFTDLILAKHPKAAEVDRAQSFRGRVLVRELFHDTTQ